MNCIKQILESNMLWSAITAIVLIIGLFRDLCKSKKEKLDKIKDFKFTTYQLIEKSFFNEECSLERNKHYLEAEKLCSKNFREELKYYIDLKLNDQKYRKYNASLHDGVFWQDDKQAQEELHNLFKKYLR